ncbi:MAG: OmpA family protein [bacterium]|nr:OmpA family protein [bacterium]
MASNLSKRLRDLDKTSQPDRTRPSGNPMPGQRKEEDGRQMDTVVFVMLGLTILMALVVFAVIFGTRTIEIGLETTIEETLKANDITNIEVRATGRDVLVVGEVNEEAQIQAVIDYVGSVEGVMHAETNLRVKVPDRVFETTTPSDPIVVTWNGSSATVTGTTSTQEVLDAIADSLASEFGSLDASGLSVREGVASERDWLSTFLQLTSEMHDQTPVGSTFASPDDRLFQVAAEFETRALRGDARQAVQDIVSAATFEFTSALTYKDAPPPPREEQVIELQENIDELIEGKVVEFETDSDVITPVGQALLDEILEALVKFPDVGIEIAGHTDDQGSDDYNLDLSRRRSDAVLAYLISRGESLDRFVVIGYGEARPLVDNATAEGRARNRRIEFKALLEA